MRHNRFYIENNLTGSTINLVDPVLLNQLRNVLKLKTGDHISVFNGDGNELEVEIKNLKKTEVELSVLEKIKKGKRKNSVNLYLAILKKENFELAVQKAVESGVTKIIPIITERTIKLGLKIDRLQLIIKEAVEQSGQVYLPKLSEPLTFSQAINQAQNSEALNIFFDIEKRNDQISDNEEINLFVGPEGGWGDEEKSMARQAGFCFYQLGQSILRAETAVIIGSWLAVNKKL